MAFDDNDVCNQLIVMMVIVGYCGVWDGVEVDGMGWLGWMG